MPDEWPAIYRAMKIFGDPPFRGTEPTRPVTVEEPSPARTSEEEQVFTG